MQNEAKTSRILGIDFGTAKVGLALADAETRIAFSYAILKNDKNFLSKLVEIIARENIKQVIIGVPDYTHAQKKKTKGEELGEMIKKSVPHIEIAYQNEMFTSISAQDNLQAKGVKNAGKVDDAEAARIILAEWLGRTF